MNNVLIIHLLTIHLLHATGNLLGVILTIAAIALLIPVLLLLIEALAALAPAPTHLPGKPFEQRPRMGVLVPAHNEAAGIDQTLRQLQPELAEGDLLVVVADNCTDETAAIARAAGVSVIEREDPEHRGKGYALDFGLGFMEVDPPDVVVIVDADCLVSPNTLGQVAQLAFINQRPVQATYLLSQPANPTPKDAISSLAFTVKNLVRPLGLKRLGMPCLLTGTGMAFPWRIIRQVPLASGNLVEDMQLSLDLAIAGYPTLLANEARVTGALPQQGHAAKSQRTRWEHGHLATIKTQVPRLLKAAVQQKRLDLLVLALDLAIPPLSLFVIVWLVITLLALPVTLLTGFYATLALLLVEGGLILLAILVAWAKFGRAELPLKTLLTIPLYVLWKIPLYLTFLIKPQTKWVRTDRDPVDSSKV